MDFDRAVADAKMSGRNLVGVAHDQLPEDVPFAGRQAIHPRENFVFFFFLTADISAGIDRTRDACEQAIPADRFFDEIDRAGVHRLHRHHDVAMPCDKNNGKQCKHPRGSDVTEGYSVDGSLGQLREPAQRLADRIGRCCDSDVAMTDCEQAACILRKVS